MKILFSLLMISLLTACNQTTRNPADAGEAASTQSRISYKLLFVKDDSKYRYDHELYLRDFETKINQHINEGWQPLGGVTMMGAFPIQAMTKDN